MVNISADIQERERQIMFVDDEVQFLASLKRVLRTFKDHWCTVFATSAGEASERALEGDIDMIVTDVHMPGKTGLEMLGELQADERTRRIPVVVLTGSRECDMKRRALDLGATDLLNKPIDSGDLRARIRSVLRMKAYEEQLSRQNEILEVKVRERTEDLAASRLEIVLRLAKAAEHRDQDTGNHVVRVAHYCRAVAEELGMDREFVDKVYLTSPLHDVGKIGVPDRILLKPGKLTEEEWIIMKNHTTIGAEILLDEPELVKRSAMEDGTRSSVSDRRANPVIEMGASIALNHHEKWDGAGYPRGLKGNAIPIEARIVALADIYDALVSERPYKAAFSEEETAAMIREQAGKHLDTAMVVAFENQQETFREIKQRFAN